MLDVFDYSATFAPLTLKQGEYLLSIVNNTIEEPDDWFWSSTLPPPTQDYVHFYRESDEELWQGNFLGNMAFAIAGESISVPEPSTILGTLIALGLGAISIKSKNK
jgi:hypothetical protein